MMAMSVCSLIVKRPGFNSHFSPNVLHVRYGMTAPQKLPIGYAMSMATSPVMLIDGDLMENNVFSPLPKIEKIVPITQTRKVS